MNHKTQAPKGRLNKIQLAEVIYKKHDGDKDAVVAEMMASGWTKSGASTYYMNCHNQEQIRQRIIAPGTIHRKPALQEAVETAYKRTIIVVMEIEVDQLEDTHQTAEHAVELLNGSLDNQITLIAASEKV